MDWTASVDNYCERLDASFWSEPVNALTNIAFLLSALLCWRMIGAHRDPGARLLTLVLALIGLGSFLFHTHAERWAGLADVLPILAFILIYIALATRRFFGAPLWVGLLAAAAYVPLSGLVSGLIAGLVGPLNGSVSYLPVVLAIGGYAIALRTRAPETARGLAIGVGLLCLSLGFRSIDAAICGALPLGTHFLWHLLNACMLGWMIRVYLYHALPTGPGLAPGMRPG